MKNVFLTFKELKKLYQFDFSDRPELELIRDLFVLQIYLGMRFGEFFSANIVGDAIEYTPIKTGNRVVRAPLTGTAKQILEKYSRPDAQLLVPKISLSTYNKGIKKVLKEAGINRVVAIMNPMTEHEEHYPIYEVASSHMARRTFVGLACRPKKEDGSLVVSDYDFCNSILG